MEVFLYTGLHPHDTKPDTCTMRTFAIRTSNPFSWPSTVKEMGWFVNRCLSEDLTRFSTRQTTVDGFAPAVLCDDILIYFALETCLIGPHSLHHTSEWVFTLTKAITVWHVAVDTPS